MKLLLVTDESAVVDAMFLVAELLQASLQVESAITDVSGVTADLLLWRVHTKDHPLNQYHQFQAYLPRAIILVDRLSPSERLNRRIGGEWLSSENRPLYFIVLPFDIEEAAIIIRGVMQRFPLYPPSEP
jgi:hypothetical protein